jgi:hypothetical protein
MSTSLLGRDWFKPRGLLTAFTRERDNSRLNDYRNQVSARDLIRSALVEKGAQCAREARKQAALLAPGPVRDALLKANEYEAEIPEDETCK